MEPREAAELIVTMRATWERFAPDEIADQLWMEDLTGLDAEMSRRTWRYLRDHDEWAPSWTRFLAVYKDREPVWRRTLEAREALAAPPRPALEAGPPQASWREAAAKRAAELARKRLARSQAVCAERSERPRQAAFGLTGIDPELPMLTYDEVYDDSGRPRFPWGPGGLPRVPEQEAIG